MTKTFSLSSESFQQLTANPGPDLHGHRLLSSREEGSRKNKSTIANDAVNIPKASTGPNTEAGKAKSSRNAIRTGLYASRDFIRTGEEEEYAQTLIQLMDELTPEGIVEQTFATEIMGAHWRLRRCRLIEEAFSSIDDLDFDPMMDERTEKQQKSVDRARAQSHLILRRSLAELRKLQSGRTIQEQLAEHKPTPKPTPAPTQVSPIWTPSWPSPTTNSPSNFANRASIRFVTPECPPLRPPVRFVKKPVRPHETPPAPAVPAENLSAAAEKTLRLS